MKIGLLSDTHGFFEPTIVPYLREVDEIWHAGDIGTIELLDQLNAIKPTVAVYGNIDGGELRRACKEDEIFVREGVQIYMTHIAGKPPKYNYRVLGQIREHYPKMLICGHSHILKVMPDRANGLLYVNPGAAGNHGFHKVKTLIRFEITRGEIKNMEVVELGKRGAII